MARKRDAELRAAAQALATVTREPAPEPVQTPQERQASRARVDGILEKVKERMRAAPRPAPIEHWRRILEDPKACFRAKEMAREAVAHLEGNFKEVERIAVEAEMQETARRIAKQLEKPDDRNGMPA